MAGHNKWSKIKRKKGAADEQRGAQFAKIGKLIESAVRTHGKDSPAVQAALARAKEANMPKANVERSLAKGEKSASASESLVFELRGFGGVSLMVEVDSDNRKRTQEQLQIVNNKLGGQMVPDGTLKFAFERRGHVTLPAEGAIASEAGELQLWELAVDAGAEDVTRRAARAETADTEAVPALIVINTPFSAFGKVGWLWSCASACMPRTA